MNKFGSMIVPMNLGLFIINNVFVSFRSPHKLEDFNEYLNTNYANIKFTNENEVDMSIPFFRFTNLMKQQKFYYNSLL